MYFHSTFHVAVHLLIIHYFITYLWYHYVYWIMFDVILRSGVPEISYLYIAFWKQVSRYFHIITEMSFPGFSLETGYHFLTQNKGNTKHCCPQLATELWTVSLLPGSAWYRFSHSSANSCLLLYFFFFSLKELSSL